MSYAPNPGTVAWKALQHLETLPAGAEIMGSKLAEAIDAEPYQIQPCMLSLIASKMAYRRQKDEHPRSPWWYSLTDYSKLPRAPVPRVVVPDATAGDAPPFPAREAAAARTTTNGAAEGATPKDGSTSAPIELHLVVRVSHRQAERIVELLKEPSA
jgi:hypothetical protein